MGQVMGDIDRISWAIGLAGMDALKYDWPGSDTRVKAIACRW